MKVLVACEYSGIVRDEFIKLGHDAVSCDLLPSESTAGKHIIGDVKPLLKKKWDLIIAHPPCTYLTFARNAYSHYPGTYRKRLQALQFVLDIMEANSPRICIENPLGYINSAIRKSDQIIQPYYFGDNQLKTIHLWLKGLPLLKYYKQSDLFECQTSVSKPEPVYISANGKPIYGAAALPGNKGGKERSRFFKQTANAMAIQWNF